MKYFKALTIGITASSILYSSAFAQQAVTDTGTAATTASNGSTISKMFKNFDTDGDGMISDAEKTAAIAKATERLKAAMETNADLKAKLISKFDADKDGTLSDAELKTAISSHRRGEKGRNGMGQVAGIEGQNRKDGFMAKFDTDGDGVLSETEKAAALADATSRIKSEMEKNSELKTRLLEKFDADKDGALSDAELNTAAESRPGRPGMDGMNGGPGSRGRMPNIDTDGDGVISEAEKTSASASFVAKMKEDLEKNSEMKTRLLSKFDADGDGTLSDAELKTAAESRPQRPPRGEGGNGMNPPPVMDGSMPPPPDFQNDAQGSTATGVSNATSTAGTQNGASMNMDGRGQGRRGGPGGMRGMGRNR